MISENPTYDCVVVGGGASGCFFAINYKIKHPDAKVVLIEKSNKLLAKVKISGGGRCNVTHACFDPRELVKFYPRGHKELKGPFSKFQPGDTIQWFAERGVELKIEEDGRMFPTTDDSQTIIDTFMQELHAHNVEVKLSCGLESLRKNEDSFRLKTTQGDFESSKVFMATGGAKSVWQHLESIGLRIVSPVPALFTFNIKHDLIKDLQGVSVPLGNVKLAGTKFEEIGPVLITHWGLSGPGILKLSSVAATWLAERDYQFKIRLNWNFNYDFEDLLNTLKDLRENSAKQLVSGLREFDIPKRLWHRMLLLCGITEQMKLADLSNKHLNKLASIICTCELEVKGKSTNKDEFVTAGGIDLKEVDFRTMECKQIPGLYFGGEMLNIDALTGGFNFQAAWTTAWLAAENA